MQEIIKGKLLEIESRENVRIIAAIESGRLYDRIGKKAYAKVMYVMPTGVICRVSKRDLER